MSLVGDGQVRRDLLALLGCGVEHIREHFRLAPEEMFMGDQGVYVRSRVRGTTTVVDWPLEGGVPEKLIAGIKRNKSGRVLKICLRHRPLTPGEAQALCEALRHNTSTEFLDLEYCEGGDGFLALGGSGAELFRPAAPEDFAGGFQRRGKSRPDIFFKPQCWYRRRSETRVSAVDDDAPRAGEMEAEPVAKAPATCNDKKSNASGRADEKQEEPTKKAPPRTSAAKVTPALVAKIERNESGRVLKMTNAMTPEHTQALCGALRHNTSTEVLRGSRCTCDLM